MFLKYHPNRLTSQKTLLARLEQNISARSWSSNLQSIAGKLMENQALTLEDGMVLYKVSVQAMGKRTIEGQEDSSSLQAIFKKQRTNATASSSAAPSAAALKEDEDSNSSSSDSSDSSSDASNDGVDAARHMIAQGASNYLSSTALPTQRS